MPTKLFSCQLLLGILLGFILIGAQAQPIRYVKPTASGLGNGTSWENASADLQAMINASTSGNQVWVAGGTYTPNTTGLANPRSAAFSLKNGISVLGGFTGVNGTEGNVNARTAMPSSTTLSGDVGTLNNPGDNCYHVFVNFNNGLGNTAILDGVVITRGNANGGGGDGYGGGMYNYLVSPSLLNCLFTQNSADVGGAIYNQASSQPARLINCQFINNSAGFGKDVYTPQGSVDAFNCFFSGGSGFSYATAYGGTSNLTNCTFRDNPGGATNSYDNTLNLVNCILWNNGGGAAIQVVTTFTLVTVSYSLIEAGATGYINGGNNQTITRSPFDNATGPELLPCAPAIDAGNNAANATTTDVLGNDRTVRTIDIGAAEFGDTPYTVAVSALATPNTVCAGSPTSLQATASGSLNGPYSYTWTASPGASLSSASLNPTSATATTAGVKTFSLQVSDAIGCRVTGSVSVTVNALPTANILTPASTTLTCTTTALSLTATGGGTYRWENNTNAAVRSITTAGTYSVTVTSPNGCTATDSQFISFNNTLVASAGSTSSSALVGSVVSLSVTGGSAYLWSAPAGASLSSPATSSTVSATLTTSGVKTFTVVVTQGSCSQTLTVGVNAVLPPDLTPLLYARPTLLYATAPFTVVVDVVETNGVSTTGLITLKITKEAKTTLLLDNSQTSVGGRSVNNSSWSMSTDATHYILTCSAPIVGGGKLSVGLSGQFNAGSTTGLLTCSATLLYDLESNQGNNTDADKVEYFQQ